MVERQKPHAQKSHRSHRSHKAKARLENKKQKHSIPKKNKSLSINDGYASLKIDKE
jgi:hypothetical protein